MKVHNRMRKAVLASAIGPSLPLLSLWRPLESCGGVKLPQEVKNSAKTNSQRRRVGRAMYCTYRKYSTTLYWQQTVLFYIQRNFPRQLRVAIVLERSAGSQLLFLSERRQSPPIPKKIFGFVRHSNKYLVRTR